MRVMKRFIAVFLAAEILLVNGGYVLPFQAAENEIMCTDEEKASEPQPEEQQPVESQPKEAEPEEAQPEPPQESLSGEPQPVEFQETTAPKEETSNPQNAEETPQTSLPETAETPAVQSGEAEESGSSGTQEDPPAVRTDAEASGDLSGEGQGTEQTISAETLLVGAGADHSEEISTDAGADKAEEDTSAQGNTSEKEYTSEAGNTEPENAEERKEEAAEGEETGTEGTSEKEKSGEDEASPESDETGSEKKEDLPEENEEMVSESLIITLPDEYCSIEIPGGYETGKEVQAFVSAQKGYRLTKIGVFRIEHVADFFAMDDPMKAIGEKVKITGTNRLEDGRTGFTFVMPEGSAVIMTQAQEEKTGPMKRMGQDLTLDGDKADFQLTLNNLAQAQCDYPSKFLKEGVSAMTTVKPYNITLSDGTSYEMLAGFCLQADPHFGTYGAGEHSAAFLKTTGKYGDVAKALYLLSVNPKSSAFTSGGLWGQDILVNGEVVNLKEIFMGSREGEEDLSAEQSFSMAHVVVSKLYWLAQGSPSEWTWNAGGGDGFSVSGGTGILNKKGEAFVDRIISIIQDAEMIDASILKNGSPASSFSSEECTSSGSVRISPTFVWSTIPSNTLTFVNVPDGIVIVDETSGNRGTKVGGGHAFHIEAEASFAGQTVSLSGKARIFSGGGAFRSPGGENNQDLGFAAVTNTQPVELSGSFPRVKKRIRIVKIDRETGKAAPQNSAVSFAGAVYGIFSDRQCTQQIETLTLGEDGTGLSGLLDPGTYYVRETKAPKGYGMDTAVYSVSVDDTGEDEIKVTSADPVVRGDLSLMKFLDEDTNASYLQQLYDDGMLAGIRFVLTHEDPSVPTVTMQKTDRYGYTATSGGALVYGTWTIHEDPSTVPEGYQSMPDTKIKITQEKTVYRYVLSNRQPQIQVRLVKKDADTQQIIPIAHAAFQVLDSAGKPISMLSNLDLAKLTDTFETNEEGQIVFHSYFKPGVYTFREVKAPEGYLKAEDKIVRITGEERMEEYFEIVFSDPPQKGSIRIVKLDEESGEKLDGCTFEIKAAEDIKDASGMIRKMMIDGEEKELTAGTRVAQVTVSEGEAKVENLYLGTYTVCETAAGEYYTLDPTPYSVTLSPDRTEAVVTQELTITNSKTKFDLFKTDSEDQEHLLEGIVYRIFSSGDVQAEKLRQIAEKIEELRQRQAQEKTAFIQKQEEERKLYEENLGDISEEEKEQAMTAFSAQQAREAEAFEEKLRREQEEYEQQLLREMEVSDTSALGKEYTTDVEGHIHLEDLPHNSTWYVYEIRSLPGYNLDTTVHEFTVDEEGKIEGKDTKELRMDNVPNALIISKKDITGEKELPGAVLTIRDSEGNIVETWTSQETPHKILRMSAGEYTLTEEQAPSGYATAETIRFTIKDSLEVQQVTMYDSELTISISKTDITGGQELPGATLEIQDSSGKTVEKWVSTDSPHLVSLPTGKYTLTETAPPEKYATAETITFEVKDDRSVQKVEMKDAPLMVEISKKDITTQKELPGAKLKITDEHGRKVEEWISGKKPHMVSLPQGNYTLTEITAPDGYEKAVSVSFTVKDTAEIQKVEMLDEPEKKGKTTKNDTPKESEKQVQGTAAAIKTGDPFRYLPSVILIMAGLLLSACAIADRKGRRNKAGKR